MRGVSAVAVHKAVKAGRISTIDGKIDPVVATIQWDANTRARQNPGKPAPAAQSQPEAPDLVTQASSSAGASEPAAAAPETGYTAFRARREAAEAEQAELELGVKKGLLVLREDVDRAFSEISRELRDRLMACGRRTAAEVASLASAEACEAVIDREHRIVLELLVTTFRERVGAAPGAAA